MISVVGMVLEKITVVSRKYWAEIQTIPVKFSLQSKEVTTDVYWVKVKVATGTSNSYT